MPALKNSRHEAFCLALVAGKSATAAYIEAGYKKLGAGAHAARLVTNGSISARVAELKAEAATGAVMSAQRTLERITEFADGERDAITLKALELMGKHHELFVDRQKHEVGGIAERLAEALERMDGKPNEAEGEDSFGHLPPGDKARAGHPRKAAPKGKRARAR